MDDSRSTEGNGCAFEIIASTPPTELSEKVCNTCKVEKSIDDFRREKMGVLGRRATCKDCEKPTIASSNRKARSKKEVSKDVIQQALNNAAYRLLKEQLGL